MNEPLTAENLLWILLGLWFVRDGASAIFNFFTRLIYGYDPTDFSVNAFSIRERIINRMFERMVPTQSERSEVLGGLGRSDILVVFVMLGVMVVGVRWIWLAL